MIGHLKNIFLALSTLIVSTTVMPNVLEYMQILLKLSLPACIYRQLLDKPNLTYMVVLIRKTGFEDHVLIILSTGIISNNLKTMIFVNSIDKVTKMVTY